MARKRQVWAGWERGEMKGKENRWSEDNVVCVLGCWGVTDGEQVCEEVFFFK